MKKIPTTTRFTDGDIPLSALKDMTRYELALSWENRNEKPLTRKGKDQLAAEMLSCGESRTMKLLGWRFYLDGMPSWYVEQYGSTHILYAPDKTAVRSIVTGKITRINPRKV